MFTKTGRAIYVFNTILNFAFSLALGRKQQAQKRLFKRFADLGGIYVKFLQLFAVRENITDLQMLSLRDTLNVFDQVAYENINIERLLSHELGERASELQLDSSTPFAAGSFAQVYAATLQGKPVIIKVLRPSVSRFLAFDLSLLQIAAKLITSLQPHSMLNVMTVFKDFKRATMDEIDYEREVQMAIHVAKTMSQNQAVHIPVTYAELCTKHIIVQERVVGLALTDLMAANVPNKHEYVKSLLNTDLNYVMEELATELAAGSLAPGGTHCDPHPGNIYILPNNQIALIDFGISAEVLKNQPALLRLMRQYIALYKGEFDPESLAKAMISYFVPDLTKSIHVLSAYYGKQDLVQRVLGEVGVRVKQTFAERADDPQIRLLLGQYRILNLFSQVINKNNRFGLKVSIDTPAFFRGTQIFMNIIHRLDCDKQLLRRSWERVIASHEHLLGSEDIAYDNESIDYSLHTIANWFERLHYSDPNLYKRLANTWEPAK